MLRSVSTSSASASIAPIAVRAAAGADIAAGEARASVASVASPNVQQAGAPEPSAIFRYNSFEFVYRQDIGRIILVGQSPETGERVVQVPSEQALRAYERTARAKEALDSAPDKGASTPQPAVQLASQPAPVSQPAPQLAQALTAVVGGGNGNGSGFVSLSA